MPDNSKTDARQLQDKFEERITFLLLFSWIYSGVLREFFGKNTPFLAVFFGTCSGKQPICSGTLRETFGKRAFSSGILRRRSNNSARAPKGMPIMGESLAEAVCPQSFFCLPSVFLPSGTRVEDLLKVSEYLGRVRGDSLRSSGNSRQIDGKFRQLAAKFWEE